MTTGAAIKECRRCHQVLPTTSFKRDLRYADGVSSYCKSCSSEASRRSPSHTTKRGKVYEPLPNRNSIEFQVSSEFWGWLTSELDSASLAALEAGWANKLLREHEQEVARLELVIAERELEGETCAGCGNNQCSCEQPETAATFTTISSLPGIPGVS